MTDTQLGSFEESTADTGRSVGVPQLAIVITCFNYERFVARAIRSVVLQDGADYELVVVDDGSTDGSWSEIEQLEVTAYRTENSGARAACIFGLGKTTAPFVLFLDADDELEPGSLKVILANLDEGVAKLQFPLTRIDTESNVISAPIPALEAFRGRQPAERVLRTGVYTSPPTSGNVFRRDLCELLEEVDYERWTDGIMLFAAPFYGDVASLSQALGRYRIHDRNFSGLGRPPDPALLRVEISRFVERMSHLRRILARRGVKDVLVEPQATFFYQERSFYLAVAEGRKNSFGDTRRLLYSLWSGDHSAKAKCAFTGFMLLTTTLPPRNALRSLSYRLGTGRRSMVGLLRAVF